MAKFDAHRFVVLNLALLPGLARITGLARVDARSVDAGPFGRALVTVSTSNFVTADKLSAVSDAFSFGASGRSTIGYRSFVGTFRVWIATWVQRWTVAFWLVELRHPANGIRSTTEVVALVGLLSFA